MWNVAVLCDQKVCQGFRAGTGQPVFDEFVLIEVGAIRFAVDGLVFLGVQDGQVGVFPSSPGVGHVEADCCALKDACFGAGSESPPVGSSFFLGHVEVSVVRHGLSGDLTIGDEGVEFDGMVEPV